MSPGAEADAEDAAARPVAPQPWWERAFGREYLEIYAHRDDASAHEEIQALLPRLRGAPGPVLDACCGHGRHLAALRSAGVRAVGFDLSPQLLQAASRRPACQGLLARADARCSGFTQGLGAVLLLFTAFGYFSDEENLACLRSLGALLAPGGWLVIDLPDPLRLRQSLQSSTSRVLSNGHRVDERRRCDGARVIKDISYRGESWSESVRLYQASEIAQLAEQAQLRLEETWPSLLGPLRDQGRQVHWLRRPLVG